MHINQGGEGDPRACIYMWLDNFTSTLFARTSMLANFWVDHYHTLALLGEIMDSVLFLLNLKFIKL